MSYTDDDLTRLITCAKRISQAPRKDMRTEGQMQRNEMELESLDGAHSFRVFLRQSLQFSENFSIGMDYLPKDEPGSFCLLRCNGMHGAHKVHPHHLHCHIHRSKAEDVNAGLRVERHIEPTTEYAAFRDALRYFLLRVSVQSTDLSQYFPGIAQSDLFEGEASS
jgi:hypothetical protein